MPRLNKLTDYSYSPTNPASEDAIRSQIDDSIQEVYDASAKTDNVVDLTTAQSIDGIKTFLQLIKSPLTPLADNDVATKYYVDLIAANFVLGELSPGSVTDDMLSNATGQVKDRLEKNDYNTGQNAKDIARIELALSKNGIVTGDSLTKWFEGPTVRSDESIGLIDFAKTYSATVNTGTNTLDIDTLQSDKNGNVPTNLSDCYNVGEQITLADTSGEKLIISNVDDGLKRLTFTTNIVGTYSGGANAYRSNMVVNGEVWNFGAYSTVTTIDKTTPVQVVNQAYSTQGNGGRKIVVLDNLDIITAVRDSGTIRFFRSSDNGNSFTNLTAISSNVLGGFSIATNGVKLWFIGYSGGATAPVFIMDISLTGGANTTIYNGSSTTEIGECSIAISSDNTKITATWSSKNATYPNSFNIRAIQGTISAGVVAWGSVEQVTTLNTTNENDTNPSVAYNNNDYPVIIYQELFTTNDNSYIVADVYNGSTWVRSDIKNDVATRPQSNPSLTSIPLSVATKINASYTSGLLVVAWEGLDSVDDARQNIRCKASSDNGVNWFDFGVTDEKATTGNSNLQQFPSVSWNDNGNIFIIWSGIISGAYNTRLIERNSSTGYGSIEDITTEINNNILYPNSCDNYHSFDKPLSIWQDAVDSDVKFYGKWNAGTETPVTDVDVRINMSQPDPITSIQAFVRVLELAGLTVDAKASVVGASDNESYVDMTDTTTDLGTENEISSTVVVTANKKVTVKYTMTRLLTTDVVEINDFVGFVGV